jgi:hypothetical protein
MDSGLIVTPKGDVPVSVATMAKSRSEAASESNADSESKEKSPETTVKVLRADASLIVKIAKHREVTVAELFQMRDVNDFLTHLLLEEMRLETERLKKKR